MGLETEFRIYIETEFTETRNRTYKNWTQNLQEPEIEDTRNAN